MNRSNMSSQILLMKNFPAQVTSGQLLSFMHWCNVWIQAVLSNKMSCTNLTFEGFLVHIFHIEFMTFSFNWLVSWISTYGLNEYFCFENVNKCKHPVPCLLLLFKHSMKGSRNLSIVVRDPTRDGWIKGFIKRKCFGQSGLQRKKPPNCHKYATFWGFFSSNISASALKSYIKWLL